MWGIWNKHLLCINWKQRENIQPPQRDQISLSSDREDILKKKTRHHESWMVKKWCLAFRRKHQRHRGGLHVCLLDRWEYQLQTVAGLQRAGDVCLCLDQLQAIRPIAAERSLAVFQISYLRQMRINENIIIIIEYLNAQLLWLLRMSRV